MPFLTKESAPSYGRLKGRTTRSYSVSTKLTREEFDAVTNASRECGKTIGEWARETILQQARGGAAQVPNEALMVELWGMYLFLLNALSPLVRGETITAERYQSIIDKIRDVKYKAAKDAIESYHAKRQDNPASGHSPDSRA